MRFCDLFLSYKLSLKNVKSSIPFTKLPLYRKMFVFIFLILFVLSVIFVGLNKKMLALMFLVFNVITFLVFFVIDSTKHNLNTMLNEHYKPYSKKRMDAVLEILRQYDIDVNNTNSIDELINEAKIEQIKCDYISPIKKPFGILVSVIIPIVVYNANKIGEITSPNKLIEISLLFIVYILLAFSLFLMIFPLLKDIIYRDYNRYEDFICDLRQIKLFYSK